MADNIAVTPGTGASVSTDEVTTLNGATVAAVQVQRMKPVYGPDGTATDVSTTTGMPIQGTQSAASTTSWTSATALNTANTISVVGMNTVTVATVATSTFTGGVLTFEVSPDNTNWFPISMCRIDSYTVENTYTLVASTNRAWSTSVDGFTNFRVRLSTVIAGTGTLTTIVTAQTMPIEPIITVGQSVAANLQATIGAALPTGTNNIGTMNIAGRATGGSTTFTLISAATTNATSVKASAGTLKQLSIGNNGASACYVKFYNKASAPTVGTDTPVATYYVPPTSGREVPFPPEGDNYGTGIAFAITGVGTVADTTAVAATQVFINGSYV